jgi:hypothetical protein
LFFFNLIFYSAASVRAREKEKKGEVKRKRALKLV